MPQNTPYVSTPRCHPQGVSDTKEDKHKDISVRTTMSNIGIYETLKLYIVK